MKRYAFCGLFDVANYGDHLYPGVFERWMSARGWPCELTLFAPTAGPEGKQALGGERPVWPLHTLMARHREAPFDGLIVSGGALVHFRSAQLYLNPGDAATGEYRLCDAWILPALAGLEAGLPVFWNMPGVPVDFGQGEARQARFLLDAADFISARNAESAESLCALDLEDAPVVSPDPAFLLPRFEGNFSAETRRLGLPERYAVFHTNPNLSENMISDVLTALKAVADAGWPVVILPLSYAHGDERIAARLAEAAADQRIRALGPGLTAREMMAVLAGCGLYMGTSFHGAVTAFAYGHPVVGLDFARYRKTEALYRDMGAQGQYLTQADGLRETALEALRHPGDNTGLLADLQARIDQAYEAMLAKLRSPRTREPQPDTLYRYVSLTHAAHSGAALAERYVEGLVRYSEETPAYLAETQRYVAGLQTYAASLEEHLQAAAAGVPLTEDEKDRRIAVLEEQLRLNLAGVRIVSRDVAVSDLAFRNRCLTEELQALRAERRKKR